MDVSESLKVLHERLDILSWCLWYPIVPQKDRHGQPVVSVSSFKINLYEAHRVAMALRSLEPGDPGWGRLAEALTAARRCDVTQPEGQPVRLSDWRAANALEDVLSERRDTLYGREIIAIQEAAARRAVDVEPATSTAKSRNSSWTLDKVVALVESDELLKAHNLLRRRRVALAALRDKAGRCKDSVFGERALAAVERLGEWRAKAKASR